MPDNWTGTMDDVPHVYNMERPAWNDGVLDPAEQIRARIRKCSLGRDQDAAWAKQQADENPGKSFYVESGNGFFLSAAKHLQYYTGDPTSITELAAWINNRKGLSGRGARFADAAARFFIDGKVLWKKKKYRRPTQAAGGIAAMLAASSATTPVA
jgi:hypothetical protein